MEVRPNSFLTALDDGDRKVLASKFSIDSFAVRWVKIAVLDIGVNEYVLGDLPDVRIANSGFSTRFKQEQQRRRPTHHTYSYASSSETS